MKVWEADLLYGSCL